MIEITIHFMRSMMALLHSRLNVEKVQLRAAHFACSLDTVQAISDHTNTHTYAHTNTHMHTHTYTILDGQKESIFQHINHGMQLLIATPP